MYLTFRLYNYTNVPYGCTQVGYLIDVDSRLHAATWRTRPQFAHQHQQLHPDDDIASLSFKLLSALSLHSSGLLVSIDLSLTPTLR